MPDNANSRDIKLKTIQDLDQIMNAHLQWMNGYHRVLICGEQPPPGVVAANAHCLCAFGIWYENLDMTDHEPWSAHLKQIDGTHRYMHDSAAELVRGQAKSGAGSAIPAGDYDRFADYAYRFKTGVRALQMKLIKDVCLVDHLTGVWNRSSLIQRISEEYERMLRHGDTCCLCMMDLDHFKMINDQYGHAVGDQVLQAVTGVARQRLRRYDAIFRYGGEEFLFCLPKTSILEAVDSMERIRADIAGTPIRIDSCRDICITASFGVAELSPLAPIAESIEAADQALFQAKAAGRNRTCCV